MLTADFCRRCSGVAPDALCECRSDCGAPDCLPAFPARDVTPGMAIHHPCAAGVLDVASASGPDDLGLMQLRGLDGRRVVVHADWPVSPYTPQDADMAAARSIFRAA